MPSRERGNILFLILLAVVLFAALSYAVTSSVRGGGNDASSENYATMAGQILQRGNLLANTINRLRLSNGCSDTEIDFYLSGITPSQYLHSPDTRNECKVFHPSGGNVPYQTINQLLNLPTSTYTFGYDDFLGTTAIPNVGTTCTNAACSDLVWFIELAAGMDKAAFCSAFNKAANNDPTVPVTITLAPTPRFAGVYSYTATSNADGRIAHCINFTTTPTRYFIYYVLLPR